MAKVNHCNLEIFISEFPSMQCIDYYCVSKTKSTYFVNSSFLTTEDYFDWLRFQSITWIDSNSNTLTNFDPQLWSWNNRWI